MKYCFYMKVFLSNKIVFVVLLLFLFSACDVLEGMKGLDVNQSQVQIEKRLIENTTLEEQNITIKNSIVQAINNLARLQSELKKLNQSIENISINIDNVSNDTSLNAETLDYLNELSVLTEKSSVFVSSLYDSTRKWSSYLLRQNSSNLNFTDDSTEIIDSVNKPLKAFE